MNERLTNLSQIKHLLVKRNFESAISRMRFAEHLDPDCNRIGRLHFLLIRLDRAIKDMPEYKRLVLQCERLIADSSTNTRGAYGKEMIP